MSYVTVDQVRAIVDTDITNAELVTIIEESDEWLNVKLDEGSLSAIYLRMLSRTLTAIRCMLKDPNATGIGEYSEDRAETLKKLNLMYDEMLSDAEGGIAFRYSYADLRWPLT